MKQPLLIVFLLLCFAVDTGTQNTIHESRQTPSVFLLGSNDEEYADIIEEYPANLLSVSGDSMEKAYENWMRLMLEMEEHAEALAFDLKGLKVWINVFWNNEGGIDYITYYPKPNCRNIPFDELTAFFTSFIKSYQNGQSGQSGYSHYGSASFPSFAQMFLKEQK